MRQKTIQRASRITHGLTFLAKHPGDLTSYRKFRDFTMADGQWFISNLQLVRSWQHVAGDIVECGTWRGGMSAAIAKTIRDRHSVLFDSFEGLPDAKPIDGPAAIHWSTEVRDYDNCTADEASAHLAMDRAGSNDYEIIKGWFDQTIPAWAAQRRPIAILRLDGDWYDSTMICLEHLFPLVVSGGGVIIDDYYTWDGCARAVHDYLSKMNAPERIRTTTRSVPYIIKV